MSDIILMLIKSAFVLKPNLIASIDDNVGQAMQSHEHGKVFVVPQACNKVKLSFATPEY